jgi:hypothetical protein
VTAAGRLSFKASGRRGGRRPARAAAAIRVIAAAAGRRLGRSKAAQGSAGRARLPPRPQASSVHGSLKCQPECAGGPGGPPG